MDRRRHLEQPVSARDSRWRRQSDGRHDGRRRRQRPQQPGYFTASEDTTYYVAAGASGKYTEPIDGTYRLSVTDVTDVDDFTAGTDTAGRVAVDGSVTGKIELPATATGSR